MDETLAVRRWGRRRPLLDWRDAGPAPLGALRPVGDRRVDHGSARSGHPAVDRARAHPDLDHVTGDPGARLDLWRDFGESAVLVALPRPGDLTGMPRAGSTRRARRRRRRVRLRRRGWAVSSSRPCRRSARPDDEGIAWSGRPTTASRSPATARGAVAARPRPRAAQAVRDGADALEAVEGRPWSTAPRESTERRLGGRDWSACPTAPPLARSA